ncbi:uncharacterized protein LOC108154146 [Drosophila miranda]|uniref:uncharacterized protein LOC108154146 n=1 Tax=Drosophila miranda TaxID=7229 RepID=UPI0007E7B9EF|nr:uncharacterized protein LOC108154146 [Drosophila miranda]
MLNTLARSFFFYNIWCIIGNLTPINSLHTCVNNNTETNDGTENCKYKGLRYTSYKEFLCWAKSGELHIRECDNISGDWLPKTVDCHVKQNKNKFCPDDLFEVKQNDDDPICLKISTKPEAYNDTFCYGSNKIIPLDLSSSEMTTIILFLKQKRINEYWLPIKRSNAFMPFMINLPGKRWQKVIDEHILPEHLKSDLYCLTHNLDRLKIELRDCKKFLHMVCVFKSSLLSHSGCPEGFGALSYRPNECYGINWKKKSLNHVHISEYYEKQNSIRIVLQEIIPQEKENYFFKIDSFVDRFSDKYMVIMNKYEKTKVSYENSKWFPVLSKQIIEAPSPFLMKLKFDENLRELILVIYHRNYLWTNEYNDIGVQCFTNAGYELLKKTSVNLIWQSEKKTRSIFKLTLFGDGPGEYWCEGHTILNFQWVSTQRLIAFKNMRGHTFATRLDIPCIYKNNENIVNFCIYINKNTKIFGKMIRNFFVKKAKDSVSDLVIHNVRIMNIESVKKLSMVCWCHIMAQLEISNKSYEVVSAEDIFENVSKISDNTFSSIRVYKKLMKMNSDLITVIRSIEYCFPDIFSSNNLMNSHWMQVRRGEKGTAQILCLQNNGIPYTRRCEGDFVHGAYWELLTQSINCKHAQDITQILYNLESTRLIELTPEKVVQEVKSLIKDHKQKIGPGDVYLISNIIQVSLRNLSIPNVVWSNGVVPELGQNPAKWKSVIHDIIEIYNILTDLDVDVISRSADLNSTNKFLETFENSMDTLSFLQYVDQNSFVEEDIGSKLDLEVFDYVDIGVSVQSSPNFLYFYINPLVANVSGIALFNNNISGKVPQKLKGKFYNEHYRFLQSNHDIEDFIHESNLLLATYVPKKLLNRLKTFSTIFNQITKIPPIVVIKVYSNDKLFQQANQTKAVSSHIVSISIPGYNTNLPEALPLILRRLHTNHHTDSGQYCHYWNYGNWATDGLKMSKNVEISEDIVICFLTHLAPLAYLVGVNLTFDIEIESYSKKMDDRTLDIIAVLGCSLSLLGVCCIFITASKLYSWRHKT